MRKLFFSLFVFFLLAVYSVNGQQTDSAVYYFSFPEQFHLKAVGQFQPVSMRFGEDGTDRQLRYRPNSLPQVGIGANIADIHLVATFPLPNSLARDEDTYGETRSNDLRLDINGKSLVLSFSYLYRQGFYLSDTRDLPDLPGNTTPLLPNLSAESFSMNAAYVFNSDRFSYRLVVTQHDKQRKSAGSFLLLSSIKYFRLSGDGSFVPDGFKPHFSSPTRLDDGEFSSFSLMPGYSHTFVLEDFYLNLGLALGPDLQYKEYRIDANSPAENDWQLEPKVNLRGGLGYDNGQFFSGVYFLSRQSRYSAGGLNLVHDPGFVRLSVGHRFPEPGWMQGIREMKAYRWVKNLF